MAGLRDGHEGTFFKGFFPLILDAATARPCRAADNYFGGGFAKLSAADRAIVSADSNDTRAYSTFNGPVFIVYVSRHFTDQLNG